MNCWKKSIANVHACMYHEVYEQVEANESSLTSVHVKAETTLRCSFRYLEKEHCIVHNLVSPSISIQFLR